LKVFHCEVELSIDEHKSAYVYVIPSLQCSWTETQRVNVEVSRTYNSLDSRQPIVEHFSNTTLDKNIWIIVTSNVSIRYEMRLDLKNEA